MRIVLGCQIHGFVGGLSGTVSICTMSAISFDRYYVIKYPLNMEFTKLRAKLCVLAAWVYGAIFSGIPLLKLDLGSYVPEGYLTSCSYDYLSTSNNAKIFIFVFFIAAWLAPFLLISFCYFYIFKVVKTTKKLDNKRHSVESARHMKEEQRRRQDYKLAMIVLLVILIWFAAWTPYAVVSLLGITNRKNQITPLSSMIPALFCKTSACLDPFVYAFSHPKFKAEICQIFCSRRKRKNPRFERKSALTNRCECTTYDDKDSVEEIEISLCITRFSTETAEQTEHFKGREESQPPKPEDTRPKPESWFIKPNFSNNSSIVRRVVRTWTSKRRETHVRNCTTCTSEIN